MSPGSRICHAYCSTPRADVDCHGREVQIACIECILRIQPPITSDLNPGPSRCREADRLQLHGLRPQGAPVVGTEPKADAEAPEGRSLQPHEADSLFFSFPSLLSALEPRVMI